MRPFRSGSDRLALLLVLGMLVLMQLICSAQALFNYKISVEFSNYTRYPNKYLGNYKQSLWKDNKDNSVMSFEGEVLEMVPHMNVQLNFDMIRKDKSRIHVMNFNADICKFVEGDFGINALKKIHRQVMSLANVPHKCPFPPMEYHLRNFTVRSTDFSPIVPEMNWSLKMAYQSIGTPLIDIFVEGKVRKAS